MKKPIPFGKYYLLDRISVGGMAEVFKAKAFGVEGFERLIAVKRILPSIAEDEEFITMFIDEAKIAVQLQHANIAQIFDLGKVGDSYFIALEYVSGKDVRTIFDRLRKVGQSIPIPMVAYVTMKVCEGLDYAHNKKDAAGRDLNLVHRDVSPQNILISYDGEIKLIDFGIAKAAGKAGKTQAGILKGKFGYMSPEQVRGLPLDRRSDIFAVGICMWEMITGERLFIGESDFSTLEKVRNVEITPPSSYNRRIPEDLETIILRALSKEVEDRYQTAMDLHDDLQSWMYTSGNFFARKDLAAFQYGLFETDIKREAESNEGGIELASSTVPPPPKGVVRPADSQRQIRPGAPPLPPKRSQTGSSSARRMAGATPPPSGPPPTAAVRNIRAKSRDPSPPVSLSGGPTSGIDSFDAPPPGPSVPPPSPVAQSSREPISISPPELPNQGLAPSAPPALDGALAMDDWDDDEPPTNIYSKNAAAELAQAAIAQEQVIQAAPRSDVIPAFSQTQEMAQLQSPKKLSRKWITGAIVMALVSISAVMYFIFFLTPSTGTLRLNVVPNKQLQVILDGAKILPGTMSPFTIADLSPGEHNITIKYKSLSSRISFEIVAGKVLERTVNLETSATGFFLETEPPGASVWINDRPLEEKTPVTVNDLQPGTYMVRIAKGEAFAQKAIEVEVVEGEIKKLPVKVLELKEVEVVFNTLPKGAKAVLISGKERKTLGSTPAGALLDTTKEYQIEYSKDGYREITQPVEFEPNQEKVVLAAVTLRKADESRRSRRREPRSSSPAKTTSSSDSNEKEGTLSVQTRPWSKVYIDGKFIKNTPLVNYRLKVGNHTVVLENPSYNIRRTFRVKIKPGKAMTLVRTLI